MGPLLAYCTSWLTALPGLLHFHTEGAAGDVLVPPAHDEHVVAALLHHVVDGVLVVALVLHVQLLTRTFRTHHAHIQDVVAWKVNAM